MDAWRGYAMVGDNYHTQALYNITAALHHRFPVTFWILGPRIAAPPRPDLPAQFSILHILLSCGEARRTDIKHRDITSSGLTTTMRYSVCI